MLLRGFAHPRGVGCRRRILTAQRINSAVRKAEQHHWVCINGNTMHLTGGTSCLCLQGFKPKLTIEQQEDLAQVFKLMDGELGMFHALMRTATRPEGPPGGSAGIVQCSKACCSLLPYVCAEDGSGAIDVEELETAFQMLGEQPHLQLVAAGAT